MHYPEEGAHRLANSEESHFWFTERRLFILSLLKRFTKPQATLADVGCGTGYTALWLNHHGYPSVGIDAHPCFKLIQNQSRTSEPFLGFLMGDILSTEPEPEFDALLLLDSIEHIEKDEFFLSHVSKMLKPGGIVIITVPAFEFLWSTVDDQSGHLRRYTKKDLKRFESLKDVKLKSVFSSYFYGSLLPLYILSRKLIKKDASQTPSLETPPHQLVNFMLKMILKVEAVIAKSIGMPIGSSLFVVLKKI